MGDGMDRGHGAARLLCGDPPSARDAAGLCGEQGRGPVHPAPADRLWGTRLEHSRASRAPMSAVAVDGFVTAADASAAEARRTGACSPTPTRRAPDARVGA